MIDRMTMTVKGFERHGDKLKGDIRATIDFWRNVLVGSLGIPEHWFRDKHPAICSADVIRTKHEAKIAGFTSPPLSVVLSRGAREGVERGLSYGILDPAGRVIAFIEVVRVEEKLALARPTWVIEDCPTVKLGWTAILLKQGEGDGRATEQAGSG